MERKREFSLCRRWYGKWVPLVSSYLWDVHKYIVPCIKMESFRSPYLEMNNLFGNKFNFAILDQYCYIIFLIFEIESNTTIWNTWQNDNDWVINIYYIIYYLLFNLVKIQSETNIQSGTNIQIFIPFYNKSLLYK